MNSLYYSCNFSVRLKFFQNIVTPSLPKKKMYVVEQALCVSTVVGPGKERVNKTHPLLYRTHGLAGHLGSGSKGVRQDLQEDDNNLGKKWGRPE